MPLGRFLSAIGGRNLRAPERVMVEELEPRRLLAGEVAGAIEIPDANLEGAIRETLGKLTGPITDADMQSLTWLSAAGRGIEDLTGLEHAGNVQGLELDDNRISQIGALSGLESLQYLSLAQNRVSDIGGVGGLTGLQSLSLGANQISDISVVAGLGNLQMLFLGHNQIGSIEPVAGLTNLWQLALGNNQISDIEPLAGLPNLQSLYLEYNTFSDFGALAGLTNLQLLSLDGNGLSSVDAIAGLTELQYLSLYHNPISDIGGLSGLTNLQSLYLGDNPISDISVVANFTKLVSLAASSNPISDISAVGGLAELRYLWLDDNWISDIGALAGLTNLAMLDVTHNALDISEGSAAMGIIQGLMGAGVIVAYEPQDATLIVTGTSGNDTVYVKFDESAVRVFDNADAAGQPAVEWDIRNTSAVNVVGLDGDDTVIVEHGYSPIAPSVMFIDGGAHGAGGMNVLRIRNTGGFANVSVGDGEIVVGSMVIAYRNIQSVELESPSVGYLSVHGSVKLAGKGATRVDLLEVGAGATLDLGDRGLIVGADAEDRDAVLAQVAGLIRLGRGTGAWNGEGITSSMAKTRPYVSLAGTLNDKGGGQGALFSTFPKVNGMAAGVNDVVVKLTWSGDANLDGVVNADDYFQIDSGFISRKKGWYNGDFNYDGVVNADDYFEIDQSFIGQSGPLGAGEVGLGEVLRVEVERKREDSGILGELFSIDALL